MSLRQALYALALAVCHSTLASAHIEKRASSANFTAPQGMSWASGPVFLTLDNGYKFTLQGDGNFVITDGNNKAQWNSGFFNPCDNGRCRLQFQNDGNLVAVDYGVNPPHPFWSSGTTAHYDNDFKENLNAAYKLEFENKVPYIIMYDQGGKVVYFTIDMDRHLFGSSDGKQCTQGHPC